MWATKRFRHLFLMLAVGFGTWSLFAGQLLAQIEEEEEEPKAYIPVYIIMIAAVGLGLLIICNPSRRQVSFRKDD